MATKAALEWTLDIGPGLINSFRMLRLRHTNRSRKLAMTVNATTRFRMDRRDLRGWHLGIALQQVPSGKGPFSHLPPPERGRVQVQ